MYTNKFWGKLDVEKIIASLFVLRAVIETKSFSSAAESLKISQSTVSRKIDELEQELGVELVRRSTRSLEIKPVAIEICRKFTINARNVLATINNVQVEANKYSGDVAAVFPVMFGYLFVAPRLEEFIKAYPKINLKIDYQNDSLDAVKDYFDVGVFGFKVDNDEVKSKKLITLNKQIYCTTEYLACYGIPKTIAELQNHLVVGVAYSGSSNNAIFAINRHDETVTELPKSSLRLLANDPIHSIALGISGHALFSATETMINLHPLRNNIIRVLPEYTFGEINYFLTMSRGFLTPAQKLFVNFITECVKSIN